MTRIAAVAPVLGRHRYTQAELTEAFARLCHLDSTGRALLARLHANAGVATRYLALPLEEYARIDGFGAANDAYLRHAKDLADKAIRAALADAQLDPTDVDLIVTTSVTGVAVPSIDARLAVELGLRADVKRLPLFGLGCVGGAAALARAYDYLKAWPTHTALVVAVELCSLTLQRTDPSTANLVASALFGDGAAAVVLRGSAVHEAETPSGKGLSGPSVLASGSVLYPGTYRAMGWDIGDAGFAIVLGADVPEIVRRELGRDVPEFLATQGLSIADIATWVCHPGGPKVLDAVSETLDLPGGALAVTWRSLARIGNLSSASVLHVLHDTMATAQPAAGAYGLLLALGPGFCSELVLLRW